MFRVGVRTHDPGGHSSKYYTKRPKVAEHGQNQPLHNKGHWPKVAWDWSGPEKAKKLGRDPSVWFEFGPPTAPYPAYLTARLEHSFYPGVGRL